MLLDYGDIVCHVFGDEQRDYYSLDRLWADVPRRDVTSGDADRRTAPGAGTDREVDVVGGRVPNPFDVELGATTSGRPRREIDELDADLEVDLARTTSRRRGASR